MPRGRISVILGGSGSGKSTLLRMLTGLVRPDADLNDLSPLSWLNRGGDVARALGAIREADTPVSK